LKNTNFIIYGRLSFNEKIFAYHTSHQLALATPPFPGRQAQVPGNTPGAQ
jgi:hypothetical protein